MLEPSPPAAIAGSAPASPATAVPASIWLEIGSFDWVQIDRRDSVRYRLGPSASFDGVRMPKWVEIDTNNSPPLRLEILRVARANAPAAAFGTDWLSSAH